MFASSRKKGGDGNTGSPGSSRVDAWHSWLSGVGGAMVQACGFRPLRACLRSCVSPWDSGLVSRPSRAAWTRVSGMLTTSSMPRWVTRVTWSRASPAAGMESVRRSRQGVSWGGASMAGASRTSRSRSLVTTDVYARETANVARMAGARWGRRCQRAHRVTGTRSCATAVRYAGKVSASRRAPSIAGLRQIRACLKSNATSRKVGDVSRGSYPMGSPVRALRMGRRAHVVGAYACLKVWSSSPLGGSRWGVLRMIAPPIMGQRTW